MRHLLAVLLILPTLALGDALVDGRIALQRGDYAKAHALQGIEGWCRPGLIDQWYPAAG